MIEKKDRSRKTHSEANNADGSINTKLNILKHITLTELSSKSLYLECWLKLHLVLNLKLKRLITQTHTENLKSFDDTTTILKSAF